MLFVLNDAHSIISLFVFLFVSLGSSGARDNLSRSRGTEGKVQSSHGYPRKENKMHIYTLHYGRTLRSTTIYPPWRFLQPWYNSLWLTSSATPRTQFDTLVTSDLSVMVIQFHVLFHASQEKCFGEWKLNKYIK